MTTASRFKNFGKYVEKCPTRIRGLDDITEGGLPRGRTTLVCGGPGCGKTLLAVEFLVNGARELREPGVFVAFEESESELTGNVASLGFGLGELIRHRLMVVDSVQLERGTFEEAGSYNLEGLFIRLADSIRKVRAKRVVIDGLDTLFTGFEKQSVIRTELRRLLRWLKEQDVTTVITGEQGENTLTRNGLEEYISDCVLFLDHRIREQLATRRLRVVKYRGSKHGTSEYPALIDEKGFNIFPVSVLGLDYPVSKSRISTGVAGLDEMLGGRGYFQGGSVLISGSSGVGKTSLAASFVNGVCSQGGKCIYWSSEESAEQLIRNLSSIGLRLRRHVDSGKLVFKSVRPSMLGLEGHMVTLHHLIEEVRPVAMVLDPITNLEILGNPLETRSMLTSVIDNLKKHRITAVFTSLTRTGGVLEHSEVGVSSLMDTWIWLQVEKSPTGRGRLIYVLKSRGMAHSNEVKRLRIANDGIHIHNLEPGPFQFDEHSENPGSIPGLGDSIPSPSSVPCDLRREMEQLRTEIGSLKLKHAGAVEKESGRIAKSPRLGKVKTG